MKPKPPEQQTLELDLEDLVSSPRTVPKLDGVVIGRLTGFGPDGVPFVQFEGNPLREPIAARSTCALDAGLVHRDVALMFEGGDPHRPIVFGPIHERVAQPGTLGSDAAAKLLASFALDVDGERMEISANREIVIRVGRASITLTRAGKILIRGDYVLSRSSGVNRIKGGSVQIN